jgi:hypothetical protein
MLLKGMHDNVPIYIVPPSKWKNDVAYTTVNQQDDNEWSCAE